MYRTILMTIAMLTTTLCVFANAVTPDHGRTRIVQLQGRAIGQTRPIPPIDPTRGTSEGNLIKVNPRLCRGTPKV